MTISGTPSRAISSACACRSWCAAKRRRTPASAAARRSAARAAALDQCLPLLGPLTTQNSGADRKIEPNFEPGRQLLPGPLVHADFAASAALVAPDEHGATAVVEIRLGERERFVNAQTRAPEDDAQCAQAPPVHVVAGDAHHRTISSTVGGSAG